MTLTTEEGRHLANMAGRGYHKALSRLLGELVDQGALDLKSAAKARFATVAAFLADNNDKVGYAGSGADTIVEAGDIIEAGGFRYSVLASDDASPHVTTAGGVDADVIQGMYGWNAHAFGRIGAGTDAATIQAAIDALSADGGGVVFIPEYEHEISEALVFKTNVHIKGLGKKSLLKASVSSGAFRIFNQADDDVDNVVFDGIAFDGSINYPADSTTYKSTIANSTTAIRTSGIKATNITIKNCYFNQLSFGSIDINGNESEGITIRDNYFYKGAYVWKVISLRVPSSYTDAQRVSNARVTGNYLDTNGPQIHYDPSKEDYCASADAIHIDAGKDCVISGNVVKNAGGVGIRIEESLRVVVSGNTVIGSGSEGITFYKNSYDCSCFGNTIQGWGRTPHAYCIRDYSGTYVVAREFPRAAGPTLPADPTASSWFETWPYSVTDIDTDSIIEYSSSDYYVSTSNGILPFRGYAGISTTNDSGKIAIYANALIGDLTQDGSSKYEYASDYGITPVHSTNDAVDDSGDGNMLSGNTIVDARVYQIYHPQYHDPVNTRGTLGTAVYVGNNDSSSSIYSANAQLSETGQLIATSRSNFLANSVNFPATQVPSSDVNTLDDYEENYYTVTLTPGGGSITLGNSRLNYTKIGRLVAVTGELTVTAVSSPTGDVTMNLPFTNATSSHRSARTRAYVAINNLSGGVTGEGELVIESASSSATIQRRDDFVLSTLAANVQVGTAFVFSFIYMAAA